MAIQTLSTTLKGNFIDVVSTTVGTNPGDDTTVVLGEFTAGTTTEVSPTNRETITVKGGKGITSSSYDSAAGKITLTFSDSTTLVTGSLIGASPVFDSTVVVSTVPVGGSATASITGTALAPILNIGSVTGATGAVGDIDALEKLGVATIASQGIRVVPGNDSSTLYNEVEMLGSAGVEYTLGTFDADTTDGTLEVTTRVITWDVTDVQDTVLTFDMGGVTQTHTLGSTLGSHETITFTGLTIADAQSLKVSKDKPGRLVIHITTVVNHSDYAYIADAAKGLFGAGTYATTETPAVFSVLDIVFSGTWAATANHGILIQGLPNTLTDDTARTELDLRFDASNVGTFRGTGGSAVQSRIFTTPARGDTAANFIADMATIMNAPRTAGIVTFPAVEGDRPVDEYFNFTSSVVDTNTLRLISDVAGAWDGVTIVIDGTGDGMTLQTGYVSNALTEGNVASTNPTAGVTYKKGTIIYYPTAGDSEGYIQLASGDITTTSSVAELPGTLATWKQIT